VTPAARQIPEIQAWTSELRNSNRLTRLKRGTRLPPQLARQLTTSLSPAVARAGLDLATAQANVPEHVILHRCEPPHVPPDAQFMAIAATSHPRLRDITVAIGLAFRAAALSVRPPCVLEGSEFAPDEIFAAAHHPVPANYSSSYVGYRTDECSL
jgi:hypothetical protein